MHFRLISIIEANNMNPDQTAPNRSSLIWVHIVCIIGYQIPTADKQADFNYCELQENG